MGFRGRGQWFSKSGKRSMIAVRHSDWRGKVSPVPDIAARPGGGTIPIAKARLGSAQQQTESSPMFNLSFISSSIAAGAITITLLAPSQRDRPLPTHDPKTTIIAQGQSSCRARTCKGTCSVTCQPGKQAVCTNARMQYPSFSQGTPTCIKEGSCLCVTPL